MHFGMECGDGWYDLLDDLLSKLDYLSKNSGVQVITDQIKEKFGTLRFYYSTVVKNDLNLDIIVSKIVDDVVSVAERQSAHVCEKTGKDGVLCSRMGWLATLCKEEAQKVGYAPTNPNVAKRWDELDNKPLNEDS